MLISWAWLISNEECSSVRIVLSIPEGPCFFVVGFCFWHFLQCSLGFPVYLEVFKLFFGFIYCSVYLSKKKKTIDKLTIETSDVRLEFHTCQL